MRIAAILLSIVLFFEVLYCYLAFSNNPTIKYWREAYISTALSTMSHQWLAEWFLPEYMVEEIRLKELAAVESQENMNSQRPKPTEPTENTDPTGTVPSESEEIPTTAEPVTVPGEDPAETAFYNLFWELNRTSFEAYLDEHPETLDNGWENI